MKWNIQINNSTYDTDSISDIPQQDIRDFLLKWDDDNDFITVNTSGSTGKPKAIQLLKKDMLSSAELTGEYFDLQPNQKALLCLPTKYIAGKMMIIRAIALQLNLIAIEPSSNPMENISKNIDFAAMTPMQVKCIIESTPKKLNLINQLIIGGAPVDNQLEEKLQHITAACYSTYGMTETITHVAVKKLNGSNKSDSFEALPRVTFTSNNQECLCIKTPHLTTSTFNTSDVVLISDSKHFKWTGRIDNVINSGGVKIHPEQVEPKLKKLFENERFFITSTQDNLLGEKVILIIESDGNNLSYPSKFTDYLEPYELPKEVFFTPKFTETETGKVNRKATTKLVLNKPDL